MGDDPRIRPIDDDEGKDVIDSTGDRIGIVSAVEGGSIHVETDPGLTDSIKATLGWGDTEDTQTIDERHILEIDDDSVRLAGEDPDATSVNAGGADAMSAGPDTGPTTEGAETDVDTDPTTDRDVGEGDLSGDETAEEMDDTGDPTTEQTTGRTGAREMTDEQVSERSDDSATDEMGVPAGEDASGRQDVQDARTAEPRGTEDVQDPAPEEPRDTEDVRDTAEELDPGDPEVAPEDQPSTGEAATRGAEEDADLRDDEDRS